MVLKRKCCYDSYFKTQNLRMRVSSQQGHRGKLQRNFSWRKELSFTAIIDDKILDLINDNSIFALNDDYFDTSFLSYSLEEGLYTIEVEAETYFI